AALDAGLVSALERLVSRFQQETGIPVTLDADGAGLDRPAEVVVLRCTQEALSNVRKHSGTTTARVTLSRGTLAVSDTGRGFDPTAPTNGFGLSGMRDRLALIGGSLNVASGASGTTLTITLPLAELVEAPLPRAQGAGTVPSSSAYWSPTTTRSCEAASCRCCRRRRTSRSSGRPPRAPRRSRSPWNIPPTLC